MKMAHQKNWFDGSLMGPIVAHKYNVDLIVYTATTLPTTTQYLISKNTESRDEIMIVQEDGYIMPKESEKN